MGNTQLFSDPFSTINILYANDSPPVPAALMFTDY
ncbi:protein of unknown function [Candidatus Promineifilum breve]|uniref:Uncharacterized protein n=1 Tax=Candidatus Promineifilum breve TaxID=1806508 RepID=A0A160T1M3_9CHLR|nr:protein of unknown function [Candidatus Promineifilum breve]